MSKVVFLSIKNVSKEDVQKNVKKAMALGEWKKYIHGPKIFLKINGISDQVVPGQCPSPWVLEAVLQEVRGAYPNAEISLGDANLAAAKQLDKASILWGHRELAEKYGARFVNLSDDTFQEVPIDSKIMTKIPLPKTLLEADTILNIPVMKAHCMSLITCCLKNHWGMIPRFRHQYHPVYDQFISDINRFFSKTKFNLVDGTVSMEGNAPRTGITKVCSVIFAGNDRVAVDYKVAQYMGFDPKNVKHIWTSERDGVGSTKNIKLVGDKFYVNPFKSPEPDKQPIFYWETRMRKIPGVKQILFDTPVFNLLAEVATFYNTNIWYNKYGKKYMREIMQTPYAAEFGPIFEKHGIKL